MNEVRRNDIGGKVLIAVIALLTVTIIGFSITTAGNTDTKANANRISITKIETVQGFIQDDLKEIKCDVKEIKNAVVR